MKVETKFDIGEKIWCTARFTHKVVEAEVTGIQVYFHKIDEPFVQYTTSRESRVSEGSLFKTKELAEESKKCPT